MNERIKGLLVKAIKEVGPDDADNGAKEKTLEKFAELIVRDVLSQVEEIQRLDGVFKNKVGIDFEIDIAKEVLKNFGVE